MKKKTLIAILACSVVFVGALNAKEDDLGPGRWWRSPGVAQDLGLTENEKQALDNMFLKSRNSLIDLRGDLEKERLKLEDILEREPVNEKAAREQFKRIEDKRAKLAYERFKFILESRQLLGPDRFRTLTGKFEEMRKQRHNRPEGDRWHREER